MSARDIIASRLARMTEKRVAPMNAGAAIQSTSSPERQALKAAQASLERAQRNFEAAQATSDRSRSILETIVLESERLDERARIEAEARVDRVREAVRSGGDFSFDRDAEKTAAERSELDARRAAAEQVTADLRSEEAEAQKDVTAAREAVARSIRAVMTSAAREAGRRWAAADAEAKALRARLGRFYGPVERLVGAGEDVSRALSLNTAAQVDRLAMDVDLAVNDIWSDFASSLAFDADAEIEFSEVDRILQTRRSPAELGAEITARMFAGATP